MNINIYTQGSKILGLGHLSRIVPIYHLLISNNLKVKLFLHGDIIGQSYLKINNVDFSLITKDKSDINNEKSSFWLIDSTDIYEEEIESIIFKSKIKILLSPKFNSAKHFIFTHAILRSDPFNLSIPIKYVSEKYFVFNKGNFITKRNLLNIGIALSGSDTKSTISETVDAIINNEELLKRIGMLTVFLGGTTKIDINRRIIDSYNIDLKFISSLKSLWSFQNQIDLLIVGNGSLVDECIVENKEFILFNHNPNNRKIKSFDVSLAHAREVTDIKHLLLYLTKFCSNIKIEKKGEMSQDSFELRSSKLPIIDEILDIVDEYEVNY